MSAWSVENYFYSFKTGKLAIIIMKYGWSTVYLNIIYSLSRMVLIINYSTREETNDVLYINTDYVFYFIKIIWNNIWNYNCYEKFIKIVFHTIHILSSLLCLSTPFKDLQKMPFSKNCTN